MKKVHSIIFEEQNEVNDFINKNSIPREDVIDLRYHWGMGAYYYVLTVYADEQLQNAIKAHKRKVALESEKLERKAWIFGAIIAVVIMILILLDLTGIT